MANMGGASALRRPRAEDEEHFAGARIPTATDGVLEATEVARTRAAAWMALKEQSDEAFESKLLPRHIQSKAAARAIAMAGAELGIPPMTAYRVIHFFDGKLALASALMHALANRKVPGFRIDFVKSTEAGCWLLAWRPGYDEPQKFSFTVGDAVRANLTEKENWKKYPAAMCRARAVAAAVRALAPEAILGAIALEEADGVSWDRVFPSDAGADVIEETAAAGEAERAARKGAAGLKEQLRARTSATPAQTPPATAASKDRAAPPPGFDDGEASSAPAGFPAPRSPAEASSSETRQRAAKRTPEEARAEEASLEAMYAEEVRKLESEGLFGPWKKSNAKGLAKLSPGARKRLDELAERRFSGRDEEPPPPVQSDDEDDTPDEEDLEPAGDS